jgi:sugar lactone lactonase YvrE
MRNIMIAFALAGISALQPDYAAAQRNVFFSPDPPPPTGIALDAGGWVYLTVAGDSSIAIFAPGARDSAVPARIIGGARSGLVAPRDIALDSRGRSYVSSGSHRGPEGGAITVYAPGASGSVAPVRVIAGQKTGLVNPGRLAIGADGGVHVVNGRGGILEFDGRAAGDAAPRRRIPALADSIPPSDVAIAKGTLLVVDGEGLAVYGEGGAARHPLVAKPRPTAPSECSPGDFFGCVGNRSPSRARPLLAVGPGGEVYIAETVPRSPPDTAGRPTLFRLLDRTPRVSVYRPAESGDTTPVRRIVGTLADLGQMADLAVGGDGSLYVLSRNRILVYPPDADGEAAPVRTIAGKLTRMTAATGLALDRQGRIYVSNLGGGDEDGVEISTVLVFAPDASGDVAPVRTIGGRATRLVRPTGVAVGEDGTVYVTNGGVYNDDRGSVRIYPAEAGWDDPPVRTLIGSGTRFVAPGSIALDDADTLYVMSRARRRVTVHAPDAEAGAAPVRLLEGPAVNLLNPAGLALDREGRLYVADSRTATGINAYGADLGAVLVYRAGATGNEAPVRGIIGSFTRLNGPGGVALDRAGNVYVPNRYGTGPGSVTVFGPAADGDARPLRIIAGPATGLAAPSAVALDPHDTLYVVNSRTVTVYQPGADGDAAPVRTFARP